MDTMELVLFLLVAYGIGFWLQNKVEFIRGKSAFVDKGLDCTFCTGFHSGWLSFLVLQCGAWNEHTLNWRLLPQAVAFGFAAAAFNYAFDTLVRFVESRIIAAEADS
jgi:hypothetical protein